MMPYTPNATLGDILEDDPELTTFNNYVRHTGFIKQLDGEDEFTVFAPTNGAFDQMPAGSLGGLTSNEALLRHVVGYHIVSGRYAAEDLLNRDHLRTLEGTDVSIVRAGEGVVIGGSILEETDIRGANGYLHKIAEVMFPETRSGA